MSQVPSKNPAVLRQSHTQRTFSLQDVGQAGDQRFAGIARNLAHQTDALVRFDRQWRVVSINPQAETLLQKTREELLGKILWEAFPEALGSTFYRRYREAFETDTSVRFEEFYPSLNKWFEVQAYCSKTGTRHKPEG